MTDEHETDGYPGRVPTSPPLEPNNPRAATSAPHNPRPETAPRPNLDHRARACEDDPLPMLTDLPTPPDPDAGFDAWWGLYPRKVGKGAARRAWRRATGLATLDELMDGLTRQLPRMRATDRQWVPHPATWLNGERWADEDDEESPEVSQLPHARDLDTAPSGMTDTEYLAWWMGQRGRRGFTPNAQNREPEREYRRGGLSRIG